MKKSFSARRVPRKIGQDDEDAATHDTDTSGESISIGSQLDLRLTSPISPRPELTSKVADLSSVKQPSSKVKKPSYLRNSFAAATGDDDEGSGVVTPKRSNLSKLTVQRNAETRASFLANELSLRCSGDADNDGPKYTAAALQELKDSTPSTPLERASQIEDSSERTLDLTSKFGTSLSRYQQEQSSAIPSAAEIAERKARRARLAQEEKAEEFISLDPDDPGWEEDEDGNVVKDADGRLVLREKDKYGVQESRLVRDDEDIMEGFDDFTGDVGSRIAMGVSTLPSNREARRNEISAQIALADKGSDSEESDAEEKARNVAFEAAQTRHGTYASNATAAKDPYADIRPKTPPNISPLPNLDAVIRRLKTTLMEMENHKREKLDEMERLRKEKLRIREDEERVQGQLKEVAEKFREMRVEKGLLPRNDEDGTANAITATNATLADEDGEQEDEQDDEMDDAMDERLGLGLGMGARELGSAAIPSNETSGRAG